jgi:hypothetical protein
MRQMRPSKSAPIFTFPPCDIETTRLTRNDAQVTELGSEVLNPFETGASRSTDFVAGADHSEELHEPL